MRTLRLAFVLLALSVTPARVFADHDHEHSAPERLGHVEFPTSCAPATKEGFARGMALLHSFAYAEAGHAFADVAAKDSTCAMAYWGVAMSNFHTIWGPPTPTEFAAGRAAALRAAALSGRTGVEASKAATAGDAQRARERDYVDAIGAFYAGDGIPHATRVVAFEQGMSRVAERYPDDREAQIFHALSILGVAYNSPADKSYARQKQAAAILNRMLALEPEHPGIAHYMIHSFDYPELAELALPAARAYAKIAPSAPHALHMPSHIFTRLGMWKESIESNLASAQAAQEWIAKVKPGATAFEALHAMDYLEYAYLQSGQDDKARALVDRVAKIASFDVTAFQAGYALAAIPARYALERRAWKEAAALTLQPAAFPWNQFAYEEAIVQFARAIGAARSGDRKTAAIAIARLDTLHGGLRGAKGFDWATQVDIQRQAAAAWLARAEGRNDDAVTRMRAAADLEDKTDKHPVTPGAVLPAREQLADLLAELGKPAEALVEYEASLRASPARFNSIDGAARAAEASGQPDKAKELHDRLAAMCDGHVPARSSPAKATAE